MRPYRIFLFCVCSALTQLVMAAERPNVIIVMTDDQGMGDLSLYGNPVVKTPHLDRLAHQGISFHQFHVTSMCSPTRAALLTGRNSLENGTISTCQGLSVLRPEHPVMPMTLANAGYATGLFGKWHLGENWPNRPQDRGFQENFVLHGYGTTGIGSRWNNDYVDTWVEHNGVEKQGEGFCTDIFFNQAMEWMEEQASEEKPFFAFISTNAPHFPFWAPEEWTVPYKDTDNPEFFAMVDNLDDNMGRLMAFLEEEGLERDTVLVFTTDNGPVGGKSTWNAGMTGGKATPWEGGHRVPLFVRYPAGGIAGGHEVRGLAYVTDLYPTILDICGIDQPADSEITGISLKPAMLGQATIPTRYIPMHIQQHEIDPSRSAIMYGKWRLLWASSLFDIEEDLAQTTDVAHANPDVFTDMWKWYRDYFYEHLEYATTAIPRVIGSEHQRLVRLDSSMWLGARADGQNSVRRAQVRGAGPEGAPWKIKAERTGKYSIKLRRWPVESGLALQEAAPPFQTVCSGEIVEAGIAFPIAQASLDLNGRRFTAVPGRDPSAIEFVIDIEAGEHMLQGSFRDTLGQPLCGAFYAYIEPVDKT